MESQSRSPLSAMMGMFFQTAYLLGFSLRPGLAYKVKNFLSKRQRSLCVILECLGTHTKRPEYYQKPYSSFSHQRIGFPASHSPFPQAYGHQSVPYGRSPARGLYPKSSFQPWPGTMWPMLRYEPGEIATAEQLMQSKWMKRWGLPVTKKGLNVRRIWKTNMQTPRPIKKHYKP